MNTTVTISAFAVDYSEKAYKLLYANSFEFIPKSQCKFIESQKKGEEFDNEGSNYFEIPLWLANRLKGINYYSIC